ncbi:MULTISPECIES: hypothetical protein [unclassified Nocardiopsis]|uniref:hypothetical protein n=1 Tax=unclassified Nocardiopsis TaxID=2649073 RepID=UPI0013588863|nr:MULTISPECIES: hypothetical protein [unclassified Nocardiopsis]
MADTVTVPLDPVPERPEFAADPPRGTSPEVTRRLCLGAYLDRVFRDTVVRRIVEEPERVTAPSYGFDAVPVVAHCLRAREIDQEFARREAQAQVLGVVALMAFLVWLVLGLVDAFVMGRGPVWLVLLTVVVCLVAVARALPWFLGGELGRDAARLVRSVDDRLLPGLARRAHRRRVLRILAEELSEETFTGHTPKGVPTRHSPLLRRIAREQYSSLTVYNPSDPFLGAGQPLRQWTLVQELRRREGGKALEADGPPDERVIIDLVRPQLEALSRSAAESNRDRLGALEVAECVYLPGPLPHGSDRSRLPTGTVQDDGVAHHMRAAVGEGGEGRRHFLRIRVAGWDEHVVITVFVRVHTQGGILLLEVAPHVLAPLGLEFTVMAALVDALTSGVDTDSDTEAWLRRERGLRGLGALLPPPAPFREAHRDGLGRRVRGPSFSMREYTATGELSLFQRMDVVRYVKTLQARIGEGVLQALRAAGYETDEFQRQIVNIGEGGVFVDGSVNGGAIATGENSRAADNSSRRGSDDNGKGATP